MSDDREQSPHYLEAELYDHLRSDPDIFNFLEEGSLDGIWYWDLENPDHEWFSPRFWTTLGYDPASRRHLASEWQTLVNPEDLEIATRNLKAHLKDPAHPYDQIVRYTHKSGSTVWVRCRGIAIRDSSGRPIRILGAHNDLTKLMETKDELQQLNQSLEYRIATRTAELEQSYRDKLRLSDRLQQAQKSESLALLAGGIAHDFNNLLVGVLGNASLVLENLPLNSEIRPLIESIESAGEQAAKLTHEMLAYSGRGRLQKEHFCINDLIRGMANLLASSISKNIHIDLRLAETLPFLFGDITQIRQVIMNLITNAADAMGAEGGTLSITTEARELGPDETNGEAFTAKLEPGPYVLIEVSDAGCGMDAETQRRIFDPFFSTKFSGKGLGLASTLGIIRGHKGAIQVDSEVDVGTTFRLMLPVVEGSPSSSALDALVQAKVPLGTVLIVDDELAVRKMAKATLESRGFSTVLAVDGVEAVQIFQTRSSEFSCVLLDLTMPNLSGVETFRLLQEIRPDLRAVLMSGYDESEAMELFGADERVLFLQKPFKSAQLEASLRRVLSES